MKTKEKDENEKTNFIKNDNIENREKINKISENPSKPDTSGFFTLSYKNGDKFTGQLTKGSVDSYGIYQQSNGITFEGDFSKNSNSTQNNTNNIEDNKNKNKYKKLKGKLTFYNGKSIYEGELLNGKFEGKGVLLRSNGDIYEGEFKNGLKDGMGVFLFAEGDKYIGSFSNNNFDGEGKLIIKDISEYRGKFKNGKYDGYGMLKSLINNDILIGVFKNGKINEEGFQILSNGIDMMVLLKMENLMDMEYINLKMGIFMKEILQEDISRGRGN